MVVLTDAEVARRLKAIREVPGSMAEVARALGMTPNAFRAWCQGGVAQAAVAARPDNLSQPSMASSLEPLASREVRDAAFWQRKAREAGERADAAEHLAHELAGVRGIPVDPPPWAHAPSSGGGRSIGIVHTSDGHGGEVIRPGEINGVNEFNPDIYRARMARLFDGACAIMPRWLHDDQCDGILLTMAGDLTSGDIHEELTATNALTAHDQVKLVIEVYDPGIRKLLDRFGKVHVVAVPGNHGRSTRKPWAKLAGSMSYDTLIAAMLRDRFAGNSAVTWQISEGADAHVPIYGRTICVTHGDRIGAGGGHGAVGPALPILRGTNKMKMQAQSIGQRVDLVLVGHFHTSIAAPGVLANGSVPGYSEYGNSLRAGIEPPKQWLARFSAKWGLADRLDIQLDEARPRIRMKATA